MQNKIRKRETHETIEASTGITYAVFKQDIDEVSTFISDNSYLNELQEKHFATFQHFLGGFIMFGEMETKEKEQQKERIFAIAYKGQVSFSGKTVSFVNLYYKQKFIQDTIPSLVTRVITHLKFRKSKKN